MNFSDIELELLIDGITALNDRSYPEADEAAINGLYNRLNDEVDSREFAAQKGWTEDDEAAVRALEARDDRTDPWSGEYNSQ